MRSKNRWHPLALVIAGFFILGYTIVQAHGSGLALSSEADGYLIDVDVSTFEIFPNEAVSFTFNLADEKSKKEVVFDSVWVQLKHENQVLFVGSLEYALFGLTVMVYRFANEGEYTMTTRFQDDSGDTIVEAKFPLSVSPNSPETSSNNSLIRIILFIIGIIIIAMVGRSFIRKHIRKRIE